MKFRLETVVSLLCLICASVTAFSDSGVPCYLHPSADKCHYHIKPDSPTCTSAEQRQRLTEGIRQLNRTFTILETKLISLGIIPPDNACSELPSLENGGVVYSDLNLPPRTKGRYICNEGYTIHTVNGRKQFTCTEDGVWDGDVLKVPVQCVLAVNQCDTPSEIINGNITFQDSDPSNILPGDMIEYACNEGTELRGPQYRFCQRSGNWSDDDPQCVALNTKQATNPENLGKILGSSLGSVSALVAVLVMVTVILVVYFKCVRSGRQAYRKWTDDNETSHFRRSLTLSDDDSNTGVNESSQYLFDSRRAASVKGEQVDHDVIVKTSKSGKKTHRSKTSSQLQDLEESTI